MTSLKLYKGMIHLPYNLAKNQKDYLQRCNHYITSNTSDDSSKKIMSLLDLFEYQSGIGPISTYFDSAFILLEKMATLTTKINSLFDRISAESGENIPLFFKVKQWVGRQNP